MSKDDIKKLDQLEKQELIILSKIKLLTEALAKCREQILEIRQRLQGKS